MSCNYAEGLSPYENKGVVGLPEAFDDFQDVEKKCELLASWIKSAKHVVTHTGAGISTAAGIPDFRGPKGVWTLEKQGRKPEVDISFTDAMPTKTHMALRKLVDENYVKYVVSQNIDGLHMKSGILRKQISELHGNIFIEQCKLCGTKYVRSTPTPTVGVKCLETDCKRIYKGRPCRGKLYDTLLDWEHDLPQEDLDMSIHHSSIADLNICLGTSLQILPSGKLPLNGKKFGGKMAIVTLQPTKFDKKADLIIHAYVDDVFERVFKYLCLEIPDYSKIDDPTTTDQDYMEWNILPRNIKEIKQLYMKHSKEFKKRKLEDMNQRRCKIVKTELDN